MTGYVAAQVALQCCGVHAIPVDRLLANLLREQQAVHPDATPDDIEAFLTKQVKQGDAEAVHATLRAWVDAGDDRASLLTKRQLDAARRTESKAESKTESKAEPKADAAPRKPAQPAKPAPAKKTVKPADKPAAKKSTPRRK